MSDDICRRLSSHARRAGHSRRTGDKHFAAVSGVQTRRSGARGRTPEDAARPLCAAVTVPFLSGGRRTNAAAAARGGFSEVRRRSTAIRLFTAAVTTAAEMDHPRLMKSQQGHAAEAASGTRGSERRDRPALWGGLAVS